MKMILPFIAVFCFALAGVGCKSTSCGHGHHGDAACCGKCEGASKKCCGKCGGEKKACCGKCGKDK